MKMKKITIIGATGTLGSAITKQLIKRGAQVKAVVRDVEKAKELLPEKTEIVFGDVSDSSSLTKALQGSETVYLNLNTINWDEAAEFQPEREGIINVVDAGKEVGVKTHHADRRYRLIQPLNSLSREWNTRLIASENQPWEYLKASGIHYTFFHCSVFLDSFPGFIEGKEFAIIGKHRHPVFFTNTSDLAKSIYNAIDNKETYDKALTIQGKEGISFPEAAQKFVSVYDPEIKVSEYPMETIKHLGLPSKEYEDFMEHMLSYVEQLKEEQVSEKTWELLGEPEFGIEDFARNLK